VAAGPAGPRGLVLAGLAAVGVALGVVGIVLVATAEDAEEVSPATVGFGVAVVAVPVDAEPAFARAFAQTRLAIGGPCVDLLVADTPSRRNQGLRGVTDLGGWDGMLFVRPEPAQSSFTMAGTAMDLSIGWYDDSGALLGSAEMVVCDGTDATCPTYPSPAPWSYAVEFPAGTLPPGDLSACATA